MTLDTHARRAVADITGRAMAFQAPPLVSVLKRHRRNRAIAAFAGAAVAVTILVGVAAALAPGSPTDTIVPSNTTTPSVPESLAPDSLGVPDPDAPLLEFGLIGDGRTPTPIPEPSPAPDVVVETVEIVFRDGALRPAIVQVSVPSVLRFVKESEDTVEFSFTDATIAGFELAPGAENEIASDDLPADILRYWGADQFTRMPGTIDTRDLAVAEPDGTPITVALNGWNSPLTLPVPTRGYIGLPMPEAVLVIPSYDAFIAGGFQQAALTETDLVSSGLLVSITTELSDLEEQLRAAPIPSNCDVGAPTTAAVGSWTGLERSGACDIGSIRVGFIETELGVIRYVRAAAAPSEAELLDRLLDDVQINGERRQPGVSGDLPQDALSPARITLDPDLTDGLLTLDIRSGVFGDFALYPLDVRTSNGFLEVSNFDTAIYQVAVGDHRFELAPQSSARINLAALDVLFAPVTVSDTTGFYRSTTYLDLRSLVGERSDDPLDLYVGSGDVDMHIVNWTKYPADAMDLVASGTRIEIALPDGWSEDGTDYERREAPNDPTRIRFAFQEDIALYFLVNEFGVRPIELPPTDYGTYEWQLARFVDETGLTVTAATSETIGLHEWVIILTSADEEHDALVASVLVPMLESLRYIEPE